MSIRVQWKKLCGLAIASGFVALCCTTPVHAWAKIPQQIRMLQGDSTNFSFNLPISAIVSTSNPTVASVDGNTDSTIETSLENPIEIDSKTEGQADVLVKLFGILPVKSIHVNVMPNLQVIPGGQSIGVKLKSQGIMVVGYNLIKTGTENMSPAETAGMKVGDLITDINGHKVGSAEEASTIISTSGRSHHSVSFGVKRSQNHLLINVIPAYDSQTNSYRIGLYIRDSAAGVGTLTFYDPLHHVFGALGHMITDVDTGQPIQVGQGQVIHSSVMSIDRGESGQPGEKRGIFVNEQDVMGTVSKNTQYGIFGKMPEAPDQAAISTPMPIALVDQVHEGPAKLLTVVDGQKVEQFDIQIVSLQRQTAPAIKSMIIKVTDPKLLERTGGIVQGMSGSPILQDGRVVGAVTHVFVNDPTQGYGVFVEWMLNEAGVQTKASSPAVGDVDSSVASAKAPSRTI